MIEGETQKNCQYDLHFISAVNVLSLLCQFGSTQPHPSDDVFSSSKLATYNNYSFITLILYQEYYYYYYYY